MGVNRKWHPAAADPMAVMRICGSYWESFVLQTAVIMDLFTKIADSGSVNVDEMTDACGSVDSRGVEMLLAACVGLGFLSKKNDRFFNTEQASMFLVEGGPRYQGGIAKMFAEWALPWTHLQQAVLTGKPVDVKPHDKDGEATRAYVMGMLHRGIPQAELLASEVSLVGRKRLLDVGGGPGIFSIIFCQKNSGLQAVVLDLPQILKVTKEVIDEYNVSEWVTMQEGNYLEGSFGEGYDVVLLSSMISQEGSDVIESIMQKSYDALVSGGLMLVQEQLLNDEKTGPLFAVLVGLNQLVHTPSGRAYSCKEVAKIAENVGFEVTEYAPLPEPSPFSLIRCIKP